MLNLAAVMVIVLAVMMIRVWYKCHQFDKSLEACKDLSNQETLDLYWSMVRGASFDDILLMLLAVVSIAIWRVGGFRFVETEELILFIVLLRGAKYYSRMKRKVYNYDDVIDEEEQQTSNAE